MGFLDRLIGGDDDGPTREQQDQAERQREASLAAVEAGGLPLNAQARLRELAADDGAVFTSNLSVDEFALGHGLGLDPVCQVMGSSVYKLGWQFQGWSTGELTVQSEALNDARRLALGRLAQEAELAGADAVVGVDVTRGEHDFVASGIEFVAQGTAVRHPPGIAPRSDGPVLTDLSLQDHWKLLQTGYEPVGVVAASTVYYVVASRQTRRATTGWGQWSNQELTDFTQGVYSARELALANLQDQARKLGAEGIVGVGLDQDIRTREVGGENNKREDLIITFHAIGTGIRASGRPASLTVRPVVPQGARP